MFTSDTARHGGPRNWKFSPKLHALIEAVVCVIVQMHPQKTVAQLSVRVFTERPVNRGTQCTPSNGVTHHTQTINTGQF